MKYITTLMVACFSLLLSSCQNTHSLQTEEKITVAKAQKEIKLGMSSSAVVEALGSPNMVTTDSQRRETWVYDKISTQVSSSRSESGVWFLIFGSTSSQKQKNSNQRTLTIIVKFDEKANVRDFSYRTSSF
jgi:outer membrane protein assembly factor BamE (lipoprotein component of BamABCDE complex)